MCMCYMLFFTIGRSSMKQYMPMKPVKRGFKVWVRADAVNGYFSTFDVYVGKPADGTVTEVGLGERVVLQLSEDLRGQKYQLYFDNFFTSCSLMETLTSQQLYGCGTTRPTRRGFPETLKTVSLERGKSAFCQRGDLVASVWMDKKPVTMLSTPSQAEDSHTALRRQRDGTRVPVQCTDAVVLYNKYMAGVDKGDQIRQYNRVRTRCYKYYKYIFCFLFDVSITNSFHLHPPPCHPVINASKHSACDLPINWSVVTTVASGWAVLDPSIHLHLCQHHTTWVPYQHSAHALLYISPPTQTSGDGAYTARSTVSQPGGVILCGTVRSVQANHHFV